MAASVTIESAHGATAMWAEVASKIRFKLADNDVVDELTPLLKLAVATLINGVSTLNTMSYWKTFRVNVTGAAIEELSNLRFFRSSVGNSGVNEFYGFTTTYQQAVGNTEGNELSGAVNLVAVVPMATAPARVSGGEGPFIGTGQFGNLLVIQWQITSAAMLGQLSDVVYTFRYDEV